LPDGLLESARFRAAARSSPDLERAAQQALAMRLGKRSATPVPGSQRAGTPVRAFSPQAVVSPPAPSGAPAAGSAAAIEALKRRYEASKARGAAAVQAPQASRAAQGSAEQASEISSLIERARKAETRQEFDRAGGYWARAFELAPTNGEVAHRAALCLRRAGSDPRRAAKYGEDAVKLDPNKAGFRATLALLYLDVGLGLRARGEVERAMKLDPQNAQVKEAAARVKAVR
jgi:tetratricopeptide (TPR) repeat protein